MLRRAVHATHNERDAYPSYSFVYVDPDVKDDRGGELGAFYRERGWGRCEDAEEDGGSWIGTTAAWWIGIAGMDAQLVCAYWREVSSPPIRPLCVRSLALPLPSGQYLPRTPCPPSARMSPPAARDASPRMTPRKRAELPRPTRRSSVCCSSETPMQTGAPKKTTRSCSNATRLRKRGAAMKLVRCRSELTKMTGLRRPMTRSSSKHRSIS
ncbi:hypothetical protein C8R44DRAFT_389228 [Mycena epipterygia]|nr:hypothetical protein C8R44DRAFT_389228 [Mycena epipterygia]